MQFKPNVVPIKFVGERRVMQPDLATKPVLFAPITYHVLPAKFTWVASLVFTLKVMPLMVSKPKSAALAGIVIAGSRVITMDKQVCFLRRLAVEHGGDMVN